MSKILILGDIHGRSFWKEPCKSWKDTIVFLGDYHDPYGEWVDEEPNNKESLINLRELSDFVKQRESEHPFSTICLLGNHDLPYFTGNLKCRYDKANEKEVKSLIESLRPQVTYELWDETVEPINKFLFSHAGFTLNWIQWHILSIDDLSKLNTSCQILEEVPYSRGGYYQYGSCIWNSLEDYQCEEHIPGYYQIFGHTWGGRTEPVITDSYAMLDCCKAFVLNTETKQIEEWKSDLQKL